MESSSWNHDMNIEADDWMKGVTWLIQIFARQYGELKISKLADKLQTKLTPKLPTHSKANNILIFQDWRNQEKRRKENLKIHPRPTNNHIDDNQKINEL